MKAAAVSMMVAGLLAGAGAEAAGPEGAAAAARTLDPIQVATMHDAMYDLRFEGRQGIAVGAHGVIVTSPDGGRTWGFAGPVPTEAALLGAALAGNHAVVVGQSGVVLTSADLKQWVAGRSGTEARLFRVELASDGFAVAVGAFGTVITSLDFGMTWTKVTIDWARFVKDGYEPHLYDVRLAADGSVIVGGEFGSLLRSRNRGATWELLHAGTASVFALTMLPSGHGVAVGQNGLVLKTEDDGRSWKELHAPTNANLVGVWAAPDGEIVAVGMRALIRSKDGGQSWQSAATVDVVRTWYEAVQGVGDNGSDGIFVVGNLGTIARLQ
jgi:photosystem II stability/assembly factor-like uncharacterized protein